jgi:hypothetical protein
MLFLEDIFLFNLPKVLYFWAIIGMYLREAELEAVY